MDGEITPAILGYSTAFGVVLLIIVGVIVPMRDEISAHIGGVFRRYVAMKPIDYVTSDDSDDSDDAISRHQDAVKENAENGKPLGPTPAELDRMIAQARYEVLARAVGTLAGRGIIPAERRSAALLAVGIEGRRYTSLKPLVDAAQAAAQAEQPPLPPEPARTPLAGRPIPPGIRFSDDLNEALGEE